MATAKLKDVAIGVGISLALALLVFIAAYRFTNPSYAFYAALTIFICGALLTPAALTLWK